MQVTPGTAQQPLSQMAQQFSMGAGKQQHNPYVQILFQKSKKYTDISGYIQQSRNPEFGYVYV